MYSAPGLSRPALISSPYWSASMLDIRSEAFRVRPGRGRDMVQHAQSMRTAKKAKAAFVAAQQVLPFEGTGSYVIPVQSPTGGNFPRKSGFLSRHD